MAYSSYQDSDNIVTGYTDLIADYLSDVPTLPTKIYAAGSTCLVIEDSSVWVLGVDGEWHELE